ncbi:cache domain-containing protein [Limibacter armeniacum]|uniref:cache domain-containing protein n=1 Tax=Limibacter armeniacum TaxID=466084 RepID=UPI002FE5D828
MKQLFTGKIASFLLLLITIITVSLLYYFFYVKEREADLEKEGLRVLNTYAGIIEEKHQYYQDSYAANSIKKSKEIEEAKAAIDSLIVQKEKCDKCTINNKAKILISTLKDFANGLKEHNKEKLKGYTHTQIVNDDSLLEKFKDDNKALYIAKLNELKSNIATLEGNNDPTVQFYISGKECPLGLWINKSGKAIVSIESNKADTKFYIELKDFIPPPINDIFNHGNLFLYSIDTLDSINNCNCLGESRGKSIPPTLFYQQNNKLQFQPNKLDTLITALKIEGGMSILDYSENDHNLKILTVPVNLAYNTYYLSAIIPLNEFKMTAGKRSLDTALVIILLSLLLIFSLPILKLILINEYEKVTLTDAYLSLLSLAAVTSLSVTLLLHFSAIIYEWNNGQDEVKKLNNEIKTSIESEINESFITSLNLWKKGLPQASGRYVTKSNTSFIEKEIYPQELILIDAQGMTEHIFINKEVAVDKTTDLSKRDYFKKIRDGEHWTKKSDPNSSYYIDYVKSYGNNKKEVITSMPFKKDDINLNKTDITINKINLNKTTVIALSSILRSVQHPILLDGYKFAVINKKGKTLFHSDNRNDLSEDFLAETGNDPFLRSALQNGANTPLNLNYRNTSHTAYLQHIDDTDWYLLTLKDNVADQVNRFMASTFTLLLNFVSISVLLLLMGVANFLKNRSLPNPFQSFAYDWLHPSGIKINDDKLGVIIPFMVGIVFFEVCLLIVINSHIFLIFYTVFTILTINILYRGLIKVIDNKIERENSRIQLYLSLFSISILTIFYLIFWEEHISYNKGDLIKTIYIIIYTIIVYIISFNKRTPWKNLYNNNTSRANTSLLLVFWLTAVSILPSFCIYKSSYNYEVDAWMRHQLLTLQKDINHNHHNIEKEAILLNYNDSTNLLNGLKNNIVNYTYHFDSLKKNNDAIPQINNIYPDIVRHHIDWIRSTILPSLYSFNINNESDTYKISSNNALISIENKEQVLDKTITFDKNTLGWQFYISLTIILLTSLFISFSLSNLIISHLFFLPSPTHKNFLHKPINTAQKQPYTKKIIVDPLIELTYLSISQPIDGTVIKITSKNISKEVVDNIRNNNINEIHSPFSLRFLEKNLHHIDNNNKEKKDKDENKQNKDSYPNEFLSELISILKDYKKCYRQLPKEKFTSAENKNVQNANQDDYPRIHHEMEENYFFFSHLWNTLSLREKNILYDFAEDGIVNINAIEVIKELINKGFLSLDFNEKLELPSQSFRLFILKAMSEEDKTKLKTIKRKKGSWTKVQPIILILIGTFLFGLLWTEQETAARITAIFAAVSTIIPTIINISNWVLRKGGEQP